MIEVIETYRLGEICIRLLIKSKHRKSVAQVKKSLRPLLLFRSTECTDDLLNLCIADFELASNLKNLSTPFLASGLGDDKLNGSILLGESPESRNDFFISSNDPQILNPEWIFLSVLFVVTWQHGMIDGLCLHAAAVSYKSSGFLFLGESGAGKSTVSKLSMEVGIPVLAEDRVFLIKQQDSYLLAAGPHQITKNVHRIDLRPKLHGIFILVKDKYDYVKLTSHIEAAKHLYAAFMQTPVGALLPANITQLAFNNIVSIARQVPTFELHFRKSSDFWALLDEQFPD